MHGLDLMLHGPLVRTFLRYCIPWTLAMLLQSSAAIVDGFFVGRYVGAMSLAALNLVMPMFSLFFGVGGHACVGWGSPGREISWREEAGSGFRDFHQNDALPAACRCSRVGGDAAVQRRTGAFSRGG